MKMRLQELRTKYWSNRSRQDKRALTLAALFLLPIIYYFLLWQPAHHAVAKLRESVPKLQADDLKLKAQAVEVEALRHRPPLAALDATALKSSIEESATRHKLRSEINALEIQGANDVHITCETIAFSKWLAWLRDLQQEQHIRVDSISVSALTQPGMVKISALLANGSNP